MRKAVRKNWRWTCPAPASSGCSAKQIKPKSSGKQPFPTGNLIDITGEARIYRNFIEGASPRGIGVGYPEKVNLCFDANTMQIAMLGMARSSTGQSIERRGQGFQRPSGHYLINLNRDQPFAQLESDDAAWPQAEGRDTPAKGIRFPVTTGEQRRPIRLQVGDNLNVADYAEPQAGALPPIVRNSASAATAKNLPAAAANITMKDGGYIVGDSMLKVSFPEIGDLQPNIRENAGRKELIIKFNVDGRVTLKQL